MTRARFTFALTLALLAAVPPLAAEPEAAAPAPGPAPDPAPTVRALKNQYDALLARQPALQAAAEQGRTLASQNLQLERQVQTLQAQSDGLREEVAALRSNDRRRWFVTGAGVLVAGLVLGMILPALRGRRRRRHGGFR